ncbi:hypothetical protein CPC08DRAFT_821078 [Agrocybe pediades]|nr:hypothetical protein CPC08DRAFT_821078 [Agrocybe pediades]
MSTTAFKVAVFGTVCGVAIGAISTEIASSQGGGNDPIGCVSKRLCAFSVVSEAVFGVVVGAVLTEIQLLLVVHKSPY